MKCGAKKRNLAVRVSLFLRHAPGMQTGRTPGQHSPLHGKKQPHIPDLIISLRSLPLPRPRVFSSRITPKMASYNMQPVQDALRQLVDLGHLRSEDMDGLSSRLTTLPLKHAIDLLFSYGTTTPHRARNLEPEPSHGELPLHDLGRRCIARPDIWEIRWTAADPEYCRDSNPGTFYQFSPD